MKLLLFLFVVMLMSAANAQIIEFTGCDNLFSTQSYTFTNKGDDGNGRNSFITEPVTGDQDCPGLGVCEFKIEFNSALSRWEFIADDGNGDFSGSSLIFFNTTNSSPNPPDLSLGVWEENTAVTTGACGGNLTSTNSTMTGDVQSTILSTTEISNGQTALKLYPNPVDHELNFEVEGEIVSMEIYDLNGKKVLETEKAELVNVSALESGVYILKLETVAGDVLQKNFIKN